MAIRRIIREDEPLLRKKSREVESFNERLFVLLDDMTETLIEANGVGLAAPQVGILRRVVLVDTGNTIIEMINPKMLSRDGEEVCDIEGCLSSPGEYGMVPRPEKVTAEYYDRNGKRHEISVDGLSARAICHELDHLDGVLFRDLAVRMLDPEELE